MIEIEATLEIKGEIYVAHRVADVPADKPVLVVEDTTAPALRGDLYIGGKKVARDTYVLQMEAEKIYGAGGTAPHSTLVLQTAVACVLQFE